MMTLLIPLSYLNILREEIICEYVKRTEVAHLIELEDNLHKVVWERVISPTNPAVTCNQETKY
jgi:hypothetical protein